MEQELLLQSSVATLPWRSGRTSLARADKPSRRGAGTHGRVLPEALLLQAALRRIDAPRIQRFQVDFESFALSPLLEPPARVCLKAHLYRLQTAYWQHMG